MTNNLPDRNTGNCLGVLRLLFASLVLVSHSSELVDGNRGRELLTSVFHTISFGMLAVDGFFIISGYLVVMSYMRSLSLVDYMTKRIARIYPGFLVASLICLTGVAYLAGGDTSTLFTAPWSHLLTALTLRTPKLPHVFVGLPYPFLDGAMWTISYEFMCYLLVVPLGLLGLFDKRRELLLVMFLTFVCGHAFGWAAWIPLPGLGTGIRFVSMFLGGSCLFAYRDMVRYRRIPGCIACLLLIACLFARGLAEAAVATFGAYVIFWCGLRPIPQLLRKIMGDTDISYGIYLYGWPAQSLIIFWFHRDISPWVVFSASLALSCSLGYLSWKLVEKPSLDFRALVAKRHLRVSLGTVA